jgi:hypothetical protein
MPQPSALPCAWESDLLSHLCHLCDCDHSDADGLVMAHMGVTHALHSAQATANDAATVLARITNTEVVNFMIIRHAGPIIRCHAVTPADILNFNAISWGQAISDENPNQLAWLAHEVICSQDTDIPITASSETIWTHLPALPWASA